MWQVYPLSREFDFIFFGAKYYLESKMNPNSMCVRMKPDFNFHRAEDGT